MTFNPDIHHRKSIRLPEYDYSGSGYYFITICTCQKLPLFGDVVEGTMNLNEMGQIVESELQAISSKQNHIFIDCFVIMPNHLHGILILSEAVGARFIAPNLSKSQYSRKGAMNGAPTIGKIIHDFKARCTHAINHHRNSKGTPVWQRNYYERIIRNEVELRNIREYIQNNPAQWALNDLYV